MFKTLLELQDINNSTFLCVPKVPPVSISFKEAKHLKLHLLGYKPVFTHQCEPIYMHLPEKENNNLHSPNTNNAFTCHICSFSHSFYVTSLK